MALASRSAGPDDAILGVAPQRVLLPASVHECADALGRAAAEGQRVGFIGGGTALALGRAPEGLEVVVRSERLARILEYAPADMVMVVEAGVTLAAVQAATREHRQMLALDAPSAARTTIGGVVATGAFGPARARYGGVRDLIIGVTLVRADGVVAKGGGKVVKNVAGFDLPKVAVGSLGTLAMIATASFRLHPLPETTVTALSTGLDAARVVALAAALREAQLEPSAMVALRVPDGGHEVGVRFEGFERGVTRQAARARDLAGCETQSADDAAAFWRRHDEARTAGPLRVKIAALPSRLVEVEARLAPLLASLRASRFAWYATLGVGFVAGRPEDAAATAAALDDARAALVAAGGSLVVEEADAAIRARVDPWGPPPGSFAVMQALKQRFDPQRRLNPGRFVGGL